MKVLWLVNIRLPLIDDILGIKTNSFGGGWLTGLSQELLKKQNIELIICYPEISQTELIKGRYENLSYYGFPINGKKNRLGKLDISQTVEYFSEIINKENPDVIHIHGTEFQYSYAMVLAAEKKKKINKVIVSIQGLVSVYAKHFYGHLPRNVKIRKTLKELVIRDGIDDRYKSFVRRGESEIKLLKKVKNVMGRTSWDRACTKLINPNAKYHFCNETLRSEFYSGQWKYKSCKKHSIFISQAGTVLKGIHNILDAVKEVKKFYPDIEVRVGGPNITSGNLINGNSYGQYIKRYIEDNGLIDNINFTGPLSSQEMKNEMLKCNVFVLPSSIENSPNSLGEAMLLGVPCISANVGGVSDLIKSDIEGYCYASDASYMLAYYILKVFDENENIEVVSKKGQERAKVTHDPKINMKSLLNTYNYIINN